ncbi:receptor-transporting protein 3-like [Paralichthys olivaceus]|uniref:receptor-transporting protein 3-like n=1 Tax=Paralichthys olivaceus TaxID=8255 RepID=UPI00097DBB0A|nr:PREDICTED: receptor-transporting protein 3-like [Paralichthys olivaceus]
MKRPTDWVPALWRETFEELLCEDNELDYGDEWTFNFNYSQNNTVTNEERKRGWKICCQNAHGDFKCASCSKTWHSARVVVLFRYRLQKGRGTVIMRPFRQTCRSCKNENYEFCGFTQEAVESTLLRLFSKIRKNCYGEEDSDADNDDGDLSEKKTKPHESHLCEACKSGICTQDDDS